MRSAERALRWLGAGVLMVALGACSTFGDKAAAPAAASPAAAPPQTAAATAKLAPQPVTPAVQRAYDGARQALASGQTADAERAFVALTKSNPDLAGPYANLGVIYRQTGKNKEAVAALEQAAKLNAASAQIANQLGIAHRMAGEFSKAKASYERSIALDAAYAPAVLNLGILYDLYLWDGARALELYDRYLQMTPGGDAQVQRWISDLRNRTGSKSAAPRKEQG
jgi:tetratricopeptide (TPR) repeat protein